MKNFLLAGILLTLCVGCATPLPKESREFSFVDSTTLKQKDAINGVANYLAKNLGDSNFAIKVKDAEAGTIITQIAIECPELKIFMDIQKHVPVYTLEVQAKDNKIRFIYEGLNDKTYGIGDGHVYESSISTAQQANAIKICAERNKNDILKAISSRNKDW